MAREVAASDLIVEWTAPPECPDQAAVVTNVERAMGDAASVNLTATATVTRAPGVFRARVHIASPAGLGERTLENPRCELLAESVALVIALSAPPAGPRRKLPPNDGLALALSVHAAASAGTSPRVALGAGGTIAVHGIAALRLELSGAYYTRQSTTFDELDIGARFQLLTFGARACRPWAVGAFELAPCLGAQLHRIAGEGFGGVVSHSDQALVWGPTVGAWGRVRLLEPVALALTVDGMVPVSRRRFVFSDVGLLHRPSAVAFQLFLGPEVRF